MKYLFEINSNHPDPVHATISWRTNAEKNILCLACKKIRPSWYPRPIDVVLKDVSSHIIMGGVWWVGINIFHTKFIEIIKEYLTDNVLGKCHNTKGNIIDEYLTCYSNKIIVVRGDKKRKYRVCPECGSILSHAPRRKKYILNTYLSDARIYQDGISYMYIDEELAMNIDFSPWPDAELEPIEVRDEPLDGQHLPGDPPELIEKYPEKKWVYGPTAEDVRQRELKSKQKRDARIQAMAEKYGPHILKMLEEQKQ